MQVPGVDTTDSNIYNMHTSRAPPPQVTAIDLDANGALLAVGLSSGVVIVYTRKGAMFSMHIQFQSHDTEVVKLRWCKGQSISMMLLVTDVNSTKLWKINRPTFIPPTHSEVVGLFTRKPMQQGTREYLKREYYNTTDTHISHIHSLSLNSDGETFLSADELRVRLWNLHAGECFNMLDLAPENLHQLTEVLRVADFHPQHCNMLAYGTSAGAVRLCDLRAAALCDATWRPLGNGDSPNKSNKLASSSGPLDEYMQGVADIAFSPAGMHLAARDYGQVKVWDLRVEDRPLARYPVMPRHQLLAHLYDRYEDGVPIDKFRCAFLGGDSLRLATGTYNDQCIIWDVNGDSGDNKVVHVGRERTSSMMIQQNNEYSARPKRRKYTDVDMNIDTHQEVGSEERDGTVNTNHLIVQSLGNTRMKTFTGEMKSEYMVDCDDNNMGGDTPTYSSPPHISFGRKVSALVADASSDIFAIAASGQLYLYDIKR